MLVGVNAHMGGQVPAGKVASGQLIQDRPGYAHLGDLDVALYTAHRGMGETNPLLEQDFYRERGSDVSSAVRLAASEVAQLEAGAKVAPAPITTRILRVVLRSPVTCPHVAQE